MPTYLEIAVKVPQVMGVFHYHLPGELEGHVQPGHLVEVPFGQQTVQGVVLRFVKEPAVRETRPVQGLVDASAVLTGAQIELAFDLAAETLSPTAACIDLMLPPGLSQMTDVLYELNDANSNNVPTGLSPLAARLVGLLQKRGPLRGRQIDQAIPRLEWRGAARALIRKNLLHSRSVLPPPSVQPKIVRTVQLACPPEQALAALPGLGKAGTPALERRQAALNFLLEEPGPVNATWVYAASGTNLTDLRKMAENGLVILGESEVWRDPLEKMELLPAEPPPLTTGQQAVWQELKNALRMSAAGEPQPAYLLHGVTGSGKTEIYLRAVEETLRQGRQAIVLVPEVALTPQTVRRFVSRFPGRVGLVHHQLSQGERYDTWRRARACNLSVIVGPRSALFSPFPNLGLIVIDECHDGSYYQYDAQPTYHAREAAIRYARLVSAVCLLGSATPDIISRYRAEREPGSPSEQLTAYRYLSLPARILAHRQVLKRQSQELGKPLQYQPESEAAGTLELPGVQLVDMRQELKAGHTSIFSRSLIASLQQVLEQKQQAILFLNRRGAATYVFCRDCGYVVKCPQCEMPLTSHGEHTREPGPQPARNLPGISVGGQHLQCHYCGYRRSMPRTCPQCKSTRIRQYGAGTERVVEEVERLFPQARTLRWDYETTRQKGSHEIIMSHFTNHRADVLVGTQMIAKGLDLPLVTLVGVVLADVGLNLPDYRASERTFQVLTQVAGRAGRSPLGGKVVLQTFQPDHYVIQAAAGHDYQDFYRQELEYRRRLRYPPFARLVRLEYRHADPDQAEQASIQMGHQVRAWLDLEERKATDMIGPVPCFFARQAGIYRWQIILRGPDPVSLLRNRAISDWRIEVDPISLL